LQSAADGPPLDGGDLPTPIPDAPIQTFFGGVHPADPANHSRLQARLAADKIPGLGQGGYPMTLTMAAIEGRAQRIAAVDALRGTAIAAMIVYHFSWDLSYFGFVSVNVAADPGWKAFARTIAGTFVALVGVSLVLATRQGFHVKPYLRRLAVIVGAAILVTVGTRYSFPEAYVFFGILHLIAFASVAALPFLWLPIPVVLIVGLAVSFLPFFFTAEFTAEIFASPALLWLGLSPRPPNSVDYVPVFPWFALTLFGVVIGRLFVRHASDSALASWTPSHLPGRAAILAGRWSLVIYLVHQLVLFNLVSMVARIAMPDPSHSIEALAQECVPACRTRGHAQPVCEAFCSCVFTGIEKAGFLEAAASGRMTAEQNEQWLELVDQCSPSDADLSGAE
jgi:uncharacterized membrane protein